VKEAFIRRLISFEEEVIGRSNRIYIESSIAAVGGSGN